MVIKMDFEDIGIVGIKTNYNKKIKSHYIRFVVDEYNIEKVIQVTKNNKWVIALDYDGDLQYLFSLSEQPTVPIIVTKEMTEVTELGIDFFMNSVPSWVVVVIKTSSDFSDMRIVYNVSQKYSNVRFCGGKFVRLTGCNIGCIQRENIPSKIPDTKISYYTEGCSCIIPSMHIEDVEGVDLLIGDKEIENEVQKVKVKEKMKENAKEAATRRVANTLDDLLM